MCYVHCNVHVGGHVVCFNWVMGVPCITALGWCALNVGIFGGGGPWVVVWVHVCT